MANASTSQQRKPKQDVYVTEIGDVLRGDEATPHLIQKDAEEILKETGIREIVEKINTKKTAAKEKSKATESDDLIGTDIKDEVESSLVNNESPDTNKTSRNCSDTQCQVEERTFFKEGEVNGTKVNKKKVDFQKVKIKKIEGSISATGADVSLATAKIVGIHGQTTVSCPVDLEATGLNLKAAHADITGVKGMAKTVASASATGANISVANTEGISGEERLRYSHSAKNMPTLDAATGYCPKTQRPLDTKQSGRTTSYHKQLKQKVHEKIGQIPEIKGTKMPSKSVSAPLSREESKQQLKDQLRTVRKSLAKQYREELGDTSDSNEKSIQDRKSDDENNINDEYIKEPPKKKPFGDQKNIHTIDMIVPTSTKKTRKLQGTNVVGFED